jgi:hypothetical protein
LFPTGSFGFLLPLSQRNNGRIFRSILAALVRTRPQPDVY